MRLNFSKRKSRPTWPWPDSCQKKALKSACKSDSNWMVVKNLDGYGLDRKIREMGWTFFCMASEITVTAVGFGEEKTLRRSFERILAMAKSKRYNSLEIAQTVSKRFLGVPYITVYARFRHIQKSMFLFREEDAQERSSTTRVGAVDSRSEGARDITPSTKLVTLFNWRHIGRGVHKNSSSPPWASPA